MNPHFHRYIDRSNLFITRDEITAEYFPTQKSRTPLRKVCASTENATPETWLSWDTFGKYPAELEKLETKIIDHSRVLTENYHIIPPSPLGFARLPPFQSSAALLPQPYLIVFKSLSTALGMSVELSIKGGMFSGRPTSFFCSIYVWFFVCYFYLLKPEPPPLIVA